ncbi:hypothetical protein [Candidatus Enterococcus ikei]|uniref:Lipoprotein n=1 Tax=Candidatus Enterococcus ikei TaxID=2815326 RepID=A0ABS3H293_9ENTE|nr:hypothetical protein [Enterococcus sp. DIV0869a]MBO0441649.1 hypothetical protein [Enterococcus sp. DIV0869a]
MKKIVLSLLVVGVSMSLVGCDSNKSSEEKSTDSSIEQTTEDTESKEAEKMSQMEEDLEEKGVTIKQYKNIMYFTREKGIDYDYFNMVFTFSSKVDEILHVRLTLKGNVDGKDKDDLVYRVNKDRLVESSGDNTDIDALAEILKSLDYSDKELVEFAWWYYNNK